MGKRVETRGSWPLVKRVKDLLITIAGGRPQGQIDRKDVYAKTAYPLSDSTSGLERRVLLLSAFRRNRTLLSTALRTMSSTGDCQAPTRPLRYPRDAGHQDLMRIGWDMYKAMGWHVSKKLDA